MLDYVHQHNPEKPFSVYRLMNHRTGRFYIGSSAQVATRFAQHKRTIQQMNHGNTDILHDSIWCDLDDWSFRLLSCHATHHEMAQRETALIRVFAGRKSCYNNSLDYVHDPVPVEWIVFNLKNGRSRQYLNHRSALRDLKVTPADFAPNAAGILQYQDYLLFKPGCGAAAAKKISGLDKTVHESLEELLGKSLSAKFIYNPSLEETPAFDHFGRLPDLLERDISVKELLRPSGRRDISTISRSAIDGQVSVGNVVVTDGRVGEIVSLTPRGRRFAIYLAKSKQKNDAKTAKQTSVTLSRIDALERRDRAGTVAMRQAAQLAKHHPGMVNELARLAEGQYLVAVHSAKHVNFHKFVVGEDAEENLSKLSGFGEILGVFERTDQPDSHDEIYLGLATRDGYVVKSSLPEHDEYKRKRIAWTRMYNGKGDSVISMFRTTGDTYIAAITTTGLAIVFDSNDVRPQGMAASGVRLLKEGTAPLAAACSISKGGRILAITQKGFALPFTAQGKYIANRADRPRKITNYKPDMGPMLWMRPLDRAFCLERHLALTTSDGREIVLPVSSALADADEKTSRLLELANGEVITAVDLVSLDADTEFTQPISSDHNDRSCDPLIQRFQSL
jgi:GIY-YIG catalytic domain